MGTRKIEGNNIKEEKRGEKERKKEKGERRMGSCGSEGTRYAQAIHVPTWIDGARREGEGLTAGAAEEQ